LKKIDTAVFELGGFKKRTGQTEKNPESSKMRLNIEIMADTPI
jgi:hypothetical protein